MKNLEICIIAALSENRAIGKSNQLLFEIPEDFKRFKALTIPHPLIMGRKTFESIGHPLPQRENIVISRDALFLASGCIVAHSLQEAINKAAGLDKEKIFIIGGGQVYEQSLPLASKLYLTLVEGICQEADTFFPDYSDFRRVIFEQPGESNGYYKYKFLELER